MCLTAFDICSCSNAEHPLKASSPMEMTELGMTRDVRAVHFENAELPIYLTVFGMMVLRQPIISVLVSFSMMPLQLSRES